MFWKKKKNQNNYKEIIGLDNTREISISSSCNFLLPYCRAIVCFLTTIGSICGFVSCFSAEYNLYAVLGFLLFFSVIIALVRNFKHSFLKNICYIAFLFIFIFLIFRYYAYVNSGYHAIVNLVYAALENYLDIPALIYYDEIIENSVATITIFLIFVGAFELLLFHMWIGERIRLIDILLISFGPYIVPLFINLYPDDIFVVCLMTAYIALIILCFGMHVRNKQTVYKKKNPWSRKIKGFSYGTNGLTYLASLISALIITLCIMLFVNLTIPYSTYVRNQKTSMLKEEITDEVKYFVTFGLSGFFNRYRATGGLNDGKLGGIHSVRPDYETDLTVTLVPTNYQPVYLRGFVGIEYTDRQWYNSTGLLQAGLVDIEQYNYFENDILLGREYETLAAQNIFRSPSRMDVLNVGANMNYRYYPYYTDYSLTPPYELDTTSGAPADTSVSTRYFILNTERTYRFYPSLTAVKTQTELPSYDVLSPYLQVPSSTKEQIIRFLEQNDLCTEYITEDSEFSRLSGSELLAVINRISDNLSSDFVYSLNPGITPNSYDFVGYFLNENKKGFCAHFATSATLIFRSLGIPARYVEGYVLSYDDLSNVRLAENAELSDYIDTSVYTSDLAVIQADIGDDKAHAWVEYYDPAFGWRVFEATTASFEDNVSSDFWGNLMNLLNSGSNYENTDTVTGTGVDTDSLSRILIRVLLVLLFIVLLLIGLVLSYHFVKRYRSYHRNRRNINVRNFYKIITYTIIRKHPSFAFITSFRGQSEFIQANYKLNKRFNNSVFEKLNSILERSAFSNMEISSTEYQYAMKLLKLMRRNILFHF